MDKVKELLRKTAKAASSKKPDSPGTDKPNVAQKAINNALVGLTDDALFIGSRVFKGLRL